MRRALVLAAVTAIAVARPEMYKENEDFQFSRSSSDEGSKSGYYGSQRGNMGGNYERAHNMDSLAQHQMGGLVKTVQGELGDGANQKSGSVFSAANSRGVFGSGHYDLSNLEGRNFQEGTSFGDSQSRSLSSQSSGYGSQAYSAANSAYGSRSQNSRHNSGYHLTGNTDQALYTSNSHDADNLQSASQYGSQAAQSTRQYGSQAAQSSSQHGSQAAQSASQYDSQAAQSERQYGSQVAQSASQFDSQAAQTGHNTGYYSQSGYHGQSGYDQGAANSRLTNTAYGSNVRLVSPSPVRVYIRPGGRVAIPLAAQTYDASQGSASTFNQNAINSEAGVLGTNDQQSVYTPNNNAKHYESSYSYRKEWEKHDTQPVATVPLAVPTVNPYPSNSELYDDTQVQGSKHEQAIGQSSQNLHSNSQYRGYNIKSASSGASRHQTGYHSQDHSAASDSAAATNVAGSSAYTHGAYDNGASANLNAANFNSQVENIGSKPKSYQSSYKYHKSWEHVGDPYVIEPATNGVYTSGAQASQRLTSLNERTNDYGSHQYSNNYHQGYSSNNGDCDENGHARVARSYNEDQVQYQQNQNIEDLGQQTQNLEDLGQLTQNLEDFGQQTQNLEDLGQQPQKLEDLSQQPQNMESLSQQSQNLEDFGQQSLNSEQLNQQSQNLGDFGQQSLNSEQLSQQSQNLGDFGQQSLNSEQLNQQSQDLGDFSQQTQSQVQEAGQNIESKWNNLEEGQQVQNHFNRIDDLGQQTQNQWDQQSQTDLGQQTQNTWSTLETKKNNGSRDTEQQLNGMEPTGHNLHGTNTVSQTQENTFEINHPSNINHLYQPESHRTEDQQTSYFLTQFQPNMNQNNQDVFAPIVPLDSHRVFQERPDWQQYLDTHHIHLNTGYGSSPDNFYQNQGYGSSVNSYANTQTHYSRSDHSTHTTSNIHLNPQESGATSLTSLWDLIDDIEKKEEQITSADKTEGFDAHHSNNENKENVQTNSNSGLTQIFNEFTFNTEDKPVQPNSPVPSTTVDSKFETTTVKMHTLYVQRGDIGPEKNLRPLEDVGRGDIGPDVSSSENVYAPNKPIEIFESKPSPSPEPHKTPEEIEILSLIASLTDKPTLVNANSTATDNWSNIQNNEKQSDRELSVVSLDQQVPHKHHFEQGSWKVQNNIQSTTTSTTPKTTSHHFVPNFNEEQSPKDIEQQNIEQQFENPGLQGSNLNQQSYNHFGGFDQQNMDEQTVDFGQQNEPLGRENMEQQFTSLNQQNVNLEQQNIDHPTGFNVEHGPLDIQQQNVDEQFERNKKLSEDLNQQSYNVFENLDQQNVNLGHNFGQQSEGFNQENINDFGQHEQFQQETLPKFDHQNENQPQKEQQLENWGQQDENLEQQSQNEKLWNPSQNLQQPKQQVETFTPDESKEPRNREPVVEPEIVTHKSINVDAPPEPVTEKVGFWNKVGSKFTNAKNKVSSWFSS